VRDRGSTIVSLLTVWYINPAMIPVLDYATGQLPIESIA